MNCEERVWNVLCYSHTAREVRDMMLSRLFYYKTKQAERFHANYIQNRPKILKKKRDYYQDNAAQTLEKHRNYYAKNREVLIAQQVARTRRRRKDSPRYMLECRLRRRMTGALRRSGADKAQRTNVLIGCTSDFLRQYIESKFKSGMCWERKSEIHIDHIRPVSSFDLFDVDQQRECFHYTNLQPLWAKDNLRKGNRHIHV